MYNLAKKTRYSAKRDSLGRALGKGLLAGLAGTAAITLSTTIEAKLRGREMSEAPAEAAEKVLGVEPESEEEREQVSMAMHWAYGTAWGGVRGCLERMGLHGVAADAAHFGAVWGTGLVMLPSLKIAPPATEWGAEEVAIDAFHHVVYAAATGAAYRLLS